MTEAELQRLAEIMAGVSARDADSSINYLQFTLGFLAGFLANYARDWIQARTARRNALKVSRANLYENLWKYKAYLEGEHQIRGKELEPEVRVWLDARLDRGWDNIRENLISNDDREYSRLVSGALLWGDFESYPQQIAALERIIEKLRREELQLLRQIEMESGEEAYKRYKRDNSLPD